MMKWNFCALLSSWVHRNDFRRRAYRSEFEYRGDTVERKRMWWRLSMTLWKRRFDVARFDLLPFPYRWSMSFEILERVISLNQRKQMEISTGRCCPHVHRSNNCIESIDWDTNKHIAKENPLEKISSSVRSPGIVSNRYLEEEKQELQWLLIHHHHHLLV